MADKAKTGSQNGVRTITDQGVDLSKKHREKMDSLRFQATLGKKRRKRK